MQALVKILKTIDVHPVLNPQISKKDYVPLDLSIHNKDLQAINVSSSKDLEAFIWDYMELAKAKAAYGGYMEKRNIYKRSQHFNQFNPDTDRNIHIGIDLWIEAGEPIFAPLDGTVHSFRNNNNFGDYGPTIILQHNLQGHSFYTLYGHLSLSSLSDVEIGKEVKMGQRIGSLGTAAVNGDYPPHLHFQIIRDLQGYCGDYPGVCNPKEMEFYQINCPDPDLLLRL